MGFFETACSSLVCIIAWGNCAAAEHVRPVFSAMLSTCGDRPDRVQLTDHELENAFNLRATFEILAAIDENNQHNLVVAMNRLSTERVVRLAEKYDMKLVIDKIRYFLFSLATQYPPSGGHLWLAAAHMSEWALCGRLVASICTGHQGQLAVRTRKMLDWRGWTPVAMLELARVSTRFSWAVCHAGAKHHIAGATANYIYYQLMLMSVGFSVLGIELISGLLPTLRRKLRVGLKAGLRGRAHSIVPPPSPVAVWQV
jgi:hypothetical protein